jgi:hypothetical protein
MSEAFQLVCDILLEMTPDLSLPSLHITYPQMESTWRLLSLACQSHPSLPVSLMEARNPPDNTQTLEQLIFCEVAKGVEPSSTETFANLDCVRRWVEAFEKSENLLELASTSVGCSGHIQYAYHFSSLSSERLPCSYVFLTANCGKN